MPEITSIQFIGRLFKLEFMIGPVGLFFRGGNLRVLPGATVWPLICVLLL